MSKQLNNNVVVYMKQGELNNIQNDFIKLFLSTFLHNELDSIIAKRSNNQAISELEDKQK